MRETVHNGQSVSIFEMLQDGASQGERMTDELNALIEAARTRPFPEEEREAQRRSFAYGNAKIENDRITWEMIVEADEEIKARAAAK
jgi:hypothetical protein